MANLLEQFRSLLPKNPLLIGTITATAGAQRYVVTDSGAAYVVRGDGAINDRVYFRPGGAIEGAAPSLTVVEIDV